jgi:hypothetical protein
LPVELPEIAHGVGRRVLATGTVRAGPPDCSASMNLRSPGFLPRWPTRSPERAVRIDAGVAALGLLEVGVDQLGLDRLDVARRIDVGPPDG